MYRNGWRAWEYLKKIYTVLDNLKNIIPWDNIRRSWITTVVGIIIILASLVSVFALEKVTWGEAAIGIVIGVILAFMNEKRKGPPPACIVLMAVSILLFQSCNICKRCTRKCPPTVSIETEKKDSASTDVKETTKDSVITTKEDKVPTVIINPCDTATGDVKDIEIERRGEDGKASVKVKSRNGQLHIDCNCDSEKLIIEKQSRELRALRYHTETAETKEVQVVPEPYIPIFGRLRWMALALVTAYIIGVFRLHKLLFKLF